MYNSLFSFLTIYSINFVLIVTNRNTLIDLNYFYCQRFSRWKENKAPPLHILTKLYVVFSDFLRTNNTLIMLYLHCNFMLFLTLKNELYEEPIKILTMQFINKYIPLQTIQCLNIRGKVSIFI